MKRPWTLRMRLVAALLVLATAGLAVFGVASVVLIRESMIQRVDQQLTALATRPKPPRDLPLPGADDLPSDLTIRLFYLDGESSVHSPVGPVLPAINSSTAPTLSRRPFTVEDKQGNAPWRIVVRQRPDGQTIVVGQSLATTDETTQRLIIIESAVGAGVLVALGAIGFLVVRLGLRPLNKIEDTSDAIAAGQLDLRVDSDSRTEVGRLGGALNTMVSRLSAALRQREQSETRLRRFVADASHELRTPLTSIRGFAELHRRGGAPERSDVDKMMGRIEDEAIRMGMLVEDLLLLARLDQERALDLTELDVRSLVEDAVHDARARDPDRPIELDIPTTPLRANADEYRLRQVITNLVTNAMTHTPAGTPIRVSVGRRNRIKGRPIAVAGALESRARVVFEVADEGPGIPVEEAPNIFDRFYRVDAARSRRRGGTGLGLAITAAILEAHGGRIELRTTPGQGARFTVLLPPP